MKMPLVALTSALFISGCSNFHIGGACEAAVENGLIERLYLEEVVKDSRFYFCRGNSNRYSFDFCETSFEAADIEETGKNAFSSECRTNIKFSAVVSNQSILKAKVKEIDDVKLQKKADADNAKSYVEQTFKNYGVSYNAEELSEGIKKRLSTLSEKENKKIEEIMSKYQDVEAGRSYFVISNVQYVSTISNNIVNINVNSIELVAEGEAQ